jgi:cleavage stimulation factor subunit 3
VRYSCYSPLRASRLKSSRFSFESYIPPVMADSDMAAFLQSLKDNPSEQTDDTDPIPITIASSDESSANEEDDDYDPTNLVTLEVSANKASGVATSEQTGATNKQSRVKGGFVIEDEDDEDDRHVQNTSSNGLLNGATMATSSDNIRSLTGTPSNTNVSLQKTEDHATQDNPTGAISLNAPSVSDSRAASSTPLPPTQSPSVPITTEQRNPSISLPKVRLPQDRVGQLEDRIAEDPRGDVDAWLELINEYRMKNRLEDARAVYARFFKLFPSAVSSSQVNFNMANPVSDRPVDRIRQDGIRQ